ncbi:hypothetical protein BCR33DRAFT_785526 [Rhizoclosmatium globosum]|uniref:Uncharacterized protein n=1 Tax=Rhizoclosmatium globosum TaxID=329046 RepID=A0A1Y2C9H7_9FUNG|nr:hypothetical protein BCR33DRAFT_785526 [Rhizoclosmatium globosum]|eukprot:ORY43693.1 hypothetical protein BCR33DRAFT_785526 [Rhizoclosmatium globosum]
MALERNSKGQPNKTRFSVTRDDLALLIHPIKNPDQLRKLGGCSELLKALCVDPNLGIYSVPKSKKTAVRTNIKETISPPTQVISSGAEVSEDERRAAFGENRLPPMRANNLFDYMLAALSDKIMVCSTFSVQTFDPDSTDLTLHSVGYITRAGLYEDFGPQADPTTPRIHWVKGSLFWLQLS